MKAFEPEKAPRLKQDPISVEMLESVKSDTEYVLMSSHLGDWETLYEEFCFSDQE